MLCLGRSEAIEPAYKRVVPPWQVEAVLAAIQDQDREVGRLVLGWVAGQRTSDPRLVEPLMDCIRGDENLRTEAATTLGGMGEAAGKSVPGLVALLKDPNPDIRSVANSILENLGPVIEPAAPEVVALLTDPDANVRAFAVSVLGALGTERKLSELILLLKDPDAEVRDRAANALEKMGPQAAEAAPQLVALLRKEWEVNGRAAQSALQTMGPALKNVLPDIFTLLKDPEPRVRIYGIKLLGGSFHRDLSVKPEGLGEMARPAVPELVLLLQDPYSDVCQTAMIALINLRETAPDSLRELVRLLKDPDYEVSRFAQFALDSMGMAAGALVPELKALLNDPDRSVCNAAASILGNLGPAAESAVPDLVRLLKRVDFKSTPTVPRLRLPRIIPSDGERDGHVDLRPNNAAALALQRLGKVAEKATPELVVLLKDPNAGIREAASTALKKPDRSVAGRCDALLDKIKSSENWAYRYHAILDFKELGAAAKAIVPKLAGMLKDPAGETQMIATAILCELGSFVEEALDELMILLAASGDSPARTFVISNLDHNRPLALKAASMLPALLKDPARETRIAAARALGNIGPAAGNAAPALIAAIQDPSYEVQAAAALALGGFAGAADKSFPYLAALLSHSDAQVRFSAETALERLGALGVNIEPAFLRALSGRSVEGRALASAHFRYASKPVPAVAWLSVEAALASSYKRPERLADAYLTSEMTPLRREALRWLGKRVLGQIPDTAHLTPPARELAVQALTAARGETKAAESPRFHREITALLQRLATER
ncbi:MAG: putative lyase [Chthoniobacteraceae bacterium]|nr:putative lyase [Chthoniobacteraceae bacterium]